MYCCIVGLNPRHRSTPLLPAFNVHKICESLDFNNIPLLQKIIRNPLGANRFYMLLKESTQYHKLVTCRVKNICSQWNFNCMKMCISEVWKPISAKTRYILQWMKCVFHEKRCIFQVKRCIF